MCFISSLMVLKADGASEPPGELLEIQIPGPQPTSHKLEPIGIEAMDLCLKDNNKHSRIFYCKIRLKNPDIHPSVCSLSLSHIVFKSCTFSFITCFFFQIASSLIIILPQYLVAFCIVFFFFKALAVVSNQP